MRVTNTGGKSFVFEDRLNRQTTRRTIGDVRAWAIEQDRTEARRLAVVLDGGQNPRELERQQAAAKAAQMAADAEWLPSPWATPGAPILRSAVRIGENDTASTMCNWPALVASLPRAVRVAGG